MAHEFSYRRRMEFSDTDLAGIVHFSNFFRFMEVTEHAFFRSLGLRLHSEVDGHVSGWVRARASCNYLRPVRYEDVVEIRLSVREKTEKSLSYSFVFLPVDGVDGVDGGDRGDGDVTADVRREIARGELRVVHVAKGPGDERLRSAPMPAEVARLVEVAPASPSVADPSSR